jgi:hypothetical protein
VPLQEGISGALVPAVSLKAGKAPAKKLRPAGSAAGRKTVASPEWNEC